MTIRDEPFMWRRCPPRPNREGREMKVRRLRILRATLRTLYGEYRALRRELA